MNTIVTSKEDILKNSRELIREKGWAAVSIRSVASACGVSVGSIYNYYDSKAELISATVESVWCEIFHRPQDEAVFQDVQTCVKWMYERMAYGCEQYPGFFTLNSLGFMQEDKADGKRHMQQIWHHILNGLCTVLQQDTKIRPGAFNAQFTVEKFADVLFSLMLSALLRQDYDPPLCWKSCADPYIDRIFFPHCCGNFIMPKMNNVHLKGTLLGKSIAISCCCSPVLCGGMQASTSCALDATLPSKPLMTVKTKSALQKSAVLQSI